MQFVTKSCGQANSLQPPNWRCPPRYNLRGIKPGHEKGPEIRALELGSSGRVRTYDLVVNSHPLYR